MKRKVRGELILDQKVKKCVLGYSQLSDKILLAKLKGKPFNIPIVVVYSPTAQSMKKSQCKMQEISIVMRDLNAKVGKELDGEVVGHFELGAHNKHGEKRTGPLTHSKQPTTVLKNT